MRARLGIVFESLSIRNYRLFAAGQLAKLIGVWMQFVAQDWLVLELSNNSASALGMSTALQFAPVILLTLYAGKLADRYDKRRLIIAANTVFSVLALALGLLVATGAVTLIWVFIFAGLMGVVNAVETPARQSFISELVPVHLLPNAISLSATTFTSARVIGPAIAGGAIFLVGLGPVFLLNTVTYLMPAIALWRMRPAELYRSEKATGEGGIRDGIAYLRRREDLLLPIVLIFFVGFIGFNFQVTLPLLAKVVFNAGPAAFGLFTTALAAGSVIGALAGTSRRTRPSVYVVFGAAIGFGITETIAGFAPTFVAAVALLIPTGFFMVYFVQAVNQRTQLGVEMAYRGRIMGIYMLVFLGSTPIGSLVIGWLSDRYGPRPGIWAGGLLSLFVALVTLGWHLRRSGSRLRLRLWPLPRLYVTASAKASTPATVRA